MYYQPAFMPKIINLIFLTNGKGGRWTKTPTHLTVPYPARSWFTFFPLTHIWTPAPALISQKHLKCPLIINHHNQVYMFFCGRIPVLLCKIECLCHNCSDILCDWQAAQRCRSLCSHSHWCRWPLTLLCAQFQLSLVNISRMSDLHSHLQNKRNLIIIEPTCTIELCGSFFGIISLFLIF
jgi:hypothetical protein